MVHGIGDSRAQSAASEEAKQEIAHRRGKDEEEGGEACPEMKTGEGATDISADLIQQEDRACEKGKQPESRKRAVDGDGHIEIRAGQ